MLITKRYRKTKLKLRAHEIYAEFRYRVIVEGILVGIFGGTCVSFFRWALGHADDLRKSLIDNSFNSLSGLLIALGVLAILMFIAFLGLILEPLSSGSGIPQVEGELQGKIETCWWRILIVKIVSGFCAITGGLSLGREGPSIQIGAMAGKGLSYSSEFFSRDRKKMIVCGAGVGLAAAFSAPLAGIIFTIEELEKKYSTEQLLCTMAGCITSDWIASGLFGLNPVFRIILDGTLPIELYWEIPVFGLILGTLGTVYNKSIALSQDLFAKMKKPWMKGAFISICIIVFAAVFPEVLGSGHSLVESASYAMWSVKYLLILLVLKFVFSMLSFGTGAPGGIFLPLLVMGGVTGALYAEIMSNITNSTMDYLSLFIILGMAGYFSAIVKAPLTGLILISEMTGVLKNLLPLAIVSFTSFIVSEMMYSQPVYTQLLNRMLKGMKIDNTKSIKAHKPESK